MIVLDCNSIPSLLNFKKLRTLSSRFLLPKCTLFIHTSPCYKRFKASACVHSFINSLKRSFTGTWLILPRHFPFINNYVRGDIINSALRQSIYILKMLFPKTKTKQPVIEKNQNWINEMVTIFPLKQNKTRTSVLFEQHSLQHLWNSGKKIQIIPWAALNVLGSSFSYFPNLYLQYLICSVCVCKLVYM